MNSLSLTLAMFLWAVTTAAQPQGKPRESSGAVKYGSFVGTNLLAYHREGTDIQWYWGDVASRREIKPLKAALPQEADVLAKLGYGAGFRVTKDNIPYRWRLAFGYFWATRAVNVSGAYHSTPLLRMSFPIQQRAEAGKVTGAEPRYPSEAVGSLPEVKGAWPPNRSDPFHEVFAQPDLNRESLYRVSQMPFLLDIAVRERSSAAGRPEAPSLEFDFTPRSAEEVVLFVVAHERASVFQYHLQAARHEKGFPIWVGQWRKLSTFTSPFVEPFRVTRVGTEYYFVTDSGAVYAAEETNGQWKTRTIWKDVARPIIAMLDEASGDTAFVFGKDFYFSLLQEAQPKACRNVTQGTKELGEPARTVYECARVLYEKGELKKSVRDK
jgi:hypothetical protein